MPAFASAWGPAGPAYQARSNGVDITCCVLQRIQLWKCILWWIKGLVHLGCPRTSNLAFLCWFGKVQVSLKCCVWLTSLEDAWHRWWHLSRSEVPLVRPGSTTAHTPLGLSSLGTWSHWAGGWGTEEGIRSPSMVHQECFPFSTPSPVVLHHQEGRRQG